MLPQTGELDRETWDILARLYELFVISTSICAATRRTAWQAPPVHLNPGLSLARAAIPLLAQSPLFSGSSGKPSVCPRSRGRGQTKDPGRAKKVLTGRPLYGMIPLALKSAVPHARVGGIGRLARFRF